MIVVLHKQDIASLNQRLPDNLVELHDVRFRHHKACEEADLVLYIPSGYTAYVLKGPPYCVGKTYSHHGWPRLLKEVLE